MKFFIVRSLFGSDGEKLESFSHFILVHHDIITSDQLSSHFLIASVS